MKKKNWLLTIAFAFVALAIVSTTVLGSTYAKYVSTVSGSASAQAAGFLVTGSTTSAAETVLLAPGEEFNVTAGITSYFSQVETQLSLTNAVTASTGAFSAANWDALVTYYRTYIATGDNAAYTVAENLPLTSLIKVPAATTAASIAASIYEAGYSETASENVWAGTYTTASNVLPAMKAGVNTALNLANINLTISWESLTLTQNEETVTNDLFDTFVGNVIAKIALANGASDLTSWAPDGTHAFSTLTFTSAHETSTVTTSITITAQQVTD